MAWDREALTLCRRRRGGGDDNKMDGKKQDEMGENGDTRGDCGKAERFLVLYSLPVHLALLLATSS